MDKSIKIKLKLCAPQFPLFNIVRAKRDHEENLKLFSLAVAVLI